MRGPCGAVTLDGYWLTDRTDERPAVREVIRIEVTKVEGRSVRYVDVVSRTAGVVDRGESDLGEGDEVVVEIDRSKATPVIVRVIGAPAADPRREEEQLDEPGLLVDGKPFVADPGAEAAELRIGQVRIAEIRFSSFRTAHRDRGRTSKRRPCVIVEIDGDMVAVSPIHGSSSAMRRTGKSRRLEGWRALGIRKSSVVSAEEVWVERTEIGDLIGVLGEADMERLKLDRRGGPDE